VNRILGKKNKDRSVNADILLNRINFFFHFPLDTAKFNTITSDSRPNCN